jgi:hypothetical protein
LLNALAALHGTGVAASTSSYESIATVTGSGNPSTISFSSIPSTYKHLQVRYFIRNTAAAYYLLCRINGISSSTYYYNHWINGDGSTASASSDNSNAGGLLPRASTTASIFAGGVVDFLDYTNTNKYKTVRALGGADRNGSGYIEFQSFLYSYNTNAISSLDFTFNGGTFDTNSSIALYGIKG